jgi:hypothetical protein
MFNDRDIAVIGIGAFAAVLCLLLPVPFPWKVGIGFFVLVTSMIAALLRLGRDRLTLEEYAVRRIRYWLRPQRWTFYSGGMPAAPVQRGKPGRAPVEQETTPPKPGKSRSQAAPRVVSWSLDPVKAERLASLLMIVIGLYFLEWLRREGAVLLGMDLAWLLP